MKPVIGITPSPSLDAQPHGRFLRHVLNEAYASAVAAAGAVPLILPPQAGNTDALLGLVDGLLLSGGADLAPARYGDHEIHPATYGIDAARDQFELDLVAAAVAADLPVLGICRGIQVLNVALGGTLIQDIPTQVASAASHRQQEDGLPADAIGHEVVVAADPVVASVFDAATIGVNSFHHQAIARLAPSLVAVAHAPDGIVEAVVRPASAFLVGVQWHPELMYRRHPEQLRPFAALVAAAGARRLAPVG
jgi:putative glutamine amidotransferase